ncbi:MAG: HEAT repeat domain-containing protein [Chloroflexi bacterium]|nr:HEAT repeat domain-containing protein [Chloroflexota bacterium]
MTDLEQLLADLNNPDWRVRANATEALGKLAKLPEWQHQSTITVQHLTNALMHALDFTHEELEFNRNGKLSRKQRTRLRNLGGRNYMLRNLWFGLVVTVGGLGVPYLYLQWNRVVGVVLAVVLLIIAPVTMVWIARSSMDEELRRKWGNRMVITNTILGVFAMGSFLAFGYMYTSAPETTPERVQMVLLVGAGMVLVLPVIHLVQNGWRKRMLVVEGFVKVVPEGPGPERRLWSSEIGIIANASLLSALVTRNLLQGRGIGSKPKDFKFVLSYSIHFGKHKFYLTKDVGQSFVDGAYYRMYCVNAFPKPMMISGEAVQSPA